jgi:acyl-coenzyme A thioesterase PaaI-like protein
VTAFFSDEVHRTFEPAPTLTKADSTTIQTLFTAPQSWARLGNILHGGFQGLLLDDVMDRVVKGLSNVDSVVSRELILRYHRPVHVTKPVCIYGYLIEERDQEFTTSGEIKDADGNLLTEAEGIFARSDPGDSRGQTPQGVSHLPVAADFAALAHWPTWAACCKGPLETISNLHVDWRLAPERKALGGFLNLPSTLCSISSAGILAALFDQALGLLGNLQGHGAMLTVRLQVTTHALLPFDEGLSLLSRGYRASNGPFKAQAWLLHHNALIAEANGYFSVLDRRRPG